MTKPQITDSRYAIVDRKKDRTDGYFRIQQDINVLSSEILRLIRLPYRAWGHIERIRSLDAQIEYLEKMLAGYEDEAKKR